MQKRTPCAKDNILPPFRREKRRVSIELRCTTVLQPNKMKWLKWHAYSVVSFMKSVYPCRFGFFIFSAARENGDMGCRMLRFETRCVCFGLLLFSAVLVIPLFCTGVCIQLQSVCI